MSAGCQVHDFASIADWKILCIDRIVKLLGQGTFGKVIEATEAHKTRRVAIKIIRAIPKYREASTIEIRVLKKLRDQDVNGTL